MREEKVLTRAVFDEKLPVYWMVSALFLLLVTFIGIPLIPIWFLLGRAFHRKQFENMECDLTERSLNIRRGVLFRVEKNIPLDKIQDVSMKEGPILRRLGLSALVVETAGQSSPQGSGDATLTGVVDAPTFRDAILNQRDHIVASGGGPPLAPGGPVSDDVLVEIRDTLKRIETLLAERE